MSSRGSTPRGWKVRSVDGFSGYTYINVCVPVYLSGPTPHEPNTHTQQGGHPTRHTSTDLSPQNKHHDRGMVRRGGGEQPGGVRLPEEPRLAPQRHALADRRVLPGCVGVDLVWDVRDCSIRPFSCLLALHGLIHTCIHIHIYTNTNTDRVHRGAGVQVGAVPTGTLRRLCVCMQHIYTRESTDPYLACMD